MASASGDAAVGTKAGRGRGGAGPRRGSASSGGSAQHDVVDLSTLDNSSAGSDGSDADGASGTEKKKGGGGDAGKHENAADDAEAKKREQRARANERKRERRAEVRAQALAKDTSTINGDETTDKLPPLRVAINSPGMGWLQPVRTSSAQGGGSGSGGGGGGKKKAYSPATAARAAAMEETADAFATAAAAAVAASSPKSKARIKRVASAADAIAARVSYKAMGGGGSFGGGGANSNATHGVGGPWAHAAGVKNLAGGGGTAAGFFAKSSTPMCPEAVKALLADPEKSKTFLSNLLEESVREVESTKRKLDQVKGERKRLARDRSKAQQRHNAILERRKQPVLPVDDALLGNLKPPEEGTLAARPLVLKKLSIAANVAGPILRAWDFLHLNSQTIMLTPFGLDDFADSLHYGAGASVMVAEVHTRLLSLIFRDGKFPKSLSAAALDATAVGGDAAVSSVFVGAATRAAAAAAAARASAGMNKTGAGKMASSKLGTPSGKGKGSSGGGTVSRSQQRPRRTTNGGGGEKEGEEEEDEEEEEEGEDAWIMALLPPRTKKNEQHDNAYNLVTALTWQTVFALALPHMAPYARAVAPPTPILGSTALCLAAAPAGTTESKRGSRVALRAAERVEADRVARGKALMRARRSLLEREYCSIPLQEKALLLEVLVDTAYETKRIRSLLADNMAARMSLESQRREEIIVYNREIREKATAQKVKVHARLRKANEELYLQRAWDSEKAAAERAKRAIELGLVAAVANGKGKSKNNGGDATAAAAAAAVANGGGGTASSNGSRAASPAPGAVTGGDGGGSGGKGKGKGKKGKGKAGGGGGEDVEDGLKTLKTKGGGIVKVNPKIFEPDRGQLLSGIIEYTAKEACGGDYKLRSIDIPEDDIDPFEAEQLAEDKAAKKIMLENLTRIELIQRRREKDARDKERNKRRQEWKERRLQRAHQVRALQSLKSATAKGDVQSLEEALKEGRKVLLEEEDDDGTRFLCPEMRDAYVALSSAKERLGRTEILQKYKGLMAEKFVRTEPLGSDRDGRRYWVFEGDSRIHVEVITRREGVPAVEDTPPKTPVSSAIELEAVADDDHANGTTTTKATGKGKAKAEVTADGDGNGTGASSSSVKQADVAAEKAPHPPMEVYHPVWSESVWMYYDTPEEFLKLIESLDPRGKREADLKQALQERFDVSDLERDAKDRAMSMSDAAQSGGSMAWREEGSEYLGKRVKRVFGRRVAGATVTKWIPKESNQGLALWHLRHDDGDEEDLEEFEVKEGMAMAEAEEAAAAAAAGSGPGNDGGVSELVKAAVDGSLTQTFSEYMNRLNKMQAIKERDLGVSALQEALLHREAGMLDDIKDRTRDYAKGSNTATPRGAWLRLVKDAAGVSDIKEAILMLEETLRGLQEGEDKMEGGRMELEAKGWNFSPDAHPLIGRRCRRFFKEFGKSNCTVAAHLPAKNGDPELWHVVHDDGDEEDMEDHEVARAMKYFDEGVEEMPDDEEENEEDEEDDDGSQDESNAGQGDGDGEEEEEEEEDEEEEEEDDEDGPEASPTQFRLTLWENWGARQGWVKAIKAAKTVGTLALGFLTLVETAYLFGIGKESMLEANRSRARMAKAWETPRGKGGKTSRRAAAVAASAAISSFASDMDVDGGDSPSGTGGKRRSSRGESSGGSGGSGEKRQRR